MDRAAHQTTHTAGAPALGVITLTATVLALFWNTSWSMVQLWWHSTTYSHCILVVPLFAWLVWRERWALQTLPWRPWWPALAGLGALGATWLASEAVAIALPAQLAVVGMVPVATASVLGLAWLRALAFPLAYLFFAVPFGESLTPQLMDWTADFTVAALKLSGIPVYRDGTHFSTPSGDWSVVEACSGVRYLFACLAVSTLYAWIVYRSLARRALFVASALAIAVIANWLRAYGIVVLAHATNNRMAVGVDHLIFGGVFFAVILAITLAVGALWREDRPGSGVFNERLEGPGVTAGSQAAGPRHRTLMLSASLATLAIWPLTAALLLAPRDDEGSVIALHIATGSDWTRSDRPLLSWRPHLRNPAHESVQAFASGGQALRVHIATFGRPTREAKLTSSLNRLVEPDDGHWAVLERSVHDIASGGTPLAVNAATLSGPGTRLLVWQWYWIDGRSTPSATVAALLQLRAHLLGHDERGAWICLYTDALPSPAFAARALNAFATEVRVVAEAPPKRPTPVSRR